jgi:chromosome segregation ATPase
MSHHTSRTEAQRHIEVDEAMLRNIRSDAQRVRTRMHLLEGEILGARQAIAEKQRVIQEAEARLHELTGVLSRLNEHEQKLRDDQDLWGGLLVG